MRSVQVLSTFSECEDGERQTLGTPWNAGTRKVGTYPSRTVCRSMCLACCCCCCETRPVDSPPSGSPEGQQPLCIPRTCSFKKGRIYQKQFEIKWLIIEIKCKKKNQLTVNCRETSWRAARSDQREPCDEPPLRDPSGKDPWQGNLVGRPSTSAGNNLASSVPRNQKAVIILLEWIALLGWTQ